jgi:beta-lactamase regulating signal transducer with metallopeptidase domain
MALGLASVATALGGYGLTWVVQSSALLGLGMLVGGFLKRFGPAVQSGVYRTTLGAVLICPVASALLAGAGFEGLTLRLSSPRADDAAPGLIPIAEPSPSQNLAIVSDNSPVSLSTTTQPVPTPSSQPLAAPPQSTVSLAAPAPIPKVVDGSDVLAGAAGVLLATWLLGSAALGLRLLLGEWRMRKLRASAVAADRDAVALCHQIAERMCVSAPAVMRSPFLFSPCLDGLRRPVILLPDDIGDNLRETFVHELAHLLRHDGVWNLLRRLATAAFWVQPLLWVLSRRLEATAEEVCDDYVVQFGADRARYAGHLLDLAGRALPPTAAAGVGMVSLRSMLARRIVRILDSSRLLSTRAGTRAVAAMVIVGFTGTLLAGLIGVGGGQRKAEAQTAPKGGDSEPGADDKTIRGQVVDPEGKPIPGATVTAVRSLGVGDGIGDTRFPRPSDHQYVHQVTGRDGRFNISFERATSDRVDESRGIQVVATAPGFGLGYSAKGGPIRLTRDTVPVNGRLVDLEGRPAAGVTICLTRIVIPSPAGPGAADGNHDSYEFPWSGSTYLHGEKDFAELIRTDSDGRFRVDGLGRGMMATLELSGPRTAFKRVWIVARAIDRRDVPWRSPEVRNLDDPGIHGADCMIAVEPTRVIEGTVHDVETHEPIAGAVVTGFQLAGSTADIGGQVRAQTDAVGRYRLVGLPKGSGHKLAVYPPLDRPYFITRFLEVPAGSGLDPVHYDIALRSGVWITGKVADVKTGTPVPAAVDYFPFLSNPHAKDYRNFDPNVTSLEFKSRYRTAPDGRFRIVGLRGGGVVTARADDKLYRAGVGAEAIVGRTEQGQLLTFDRIFPAVFQRLKEVNVPEGAESFTCDLGLDPGGSVRIRLVDTSGAPVTGTLIWGRLPEGTEHQHHNLRDESMTRIGGLIPGQPRTVLLQHKGRKIGAVTSVTASESNDGAELTVTLRPNALLKGRLVEAGGKPASGGVQIDLVPGENSTSMQIPVDGVKLDADGRFSCDVPFGGPFRVRAANRLSYGFGGRMEPEAFQPFGLAEKLNVESGQVVDFGTFNVTTGKCIELPAAQATTADVPITGRIVNLEGQPVAGVSVKVGGVQGSKSSDLTPWIEAIKKGEPPWIAYPHISADVKIPENVRREATTDKDGRFRFEGLGRERVVGLTIQGDSVAFTTIDVVTRKTEPILARGFPDMHGPGAQTVYGADFTYTARPGRPVEGVVRDARTKQPMAGVSVESWRFAGSDFVSIQQLKSVTDAHGRFRLVGMPKGRGNVVIAVPGDDQPYFMREAGVDDPPGIAPVSVEIELHRGIMITGKITDKVTGKPVDEARLHYLPFLENKFVQALPEFDKDGNVNGFQTRYAAKADGTYKLVGMPGRAIVGVESVGKTPYRSGVGSETIKGLDKNGFYKTWRNPIWPGKSWPNTLVEINPSEGTDTLTLDAQLDPGLTLRIKVVDAEGKPLPDASVPSGSRIHWSGFHAKAGSSGALFELSSFRPDEVRSVVIRHDARKLGKVVRLRAGDDAKGSVVVKLEPLATIKARVVDADGNPVSGATLRVDVEPTEGFINSLANVASDRDGRFVVPNVPTGCEYGLVAEAGTMIKERRVAFSKATVKPGEATDVGDIKFKDD